MAEVLLRVVDKTNTDPALDAVCMKAGDIVVVVPDGHPWSQAEITNPDWVVVKLPGVAVDTLLDMLAPTIDTAGRLRRKRGRMIDLTKPAIQTFLSNLSPTNRVVTLSNARNRNDFLAARLTKVAITDTVTLS